MCQKNVRTLRRLTTSLSSAVETLLDVCRGIGHTLGEAVAEQMIARLEVLKRGIRAFTTAENTRVALNALEWILAILTALEQDRETAYEAFFNPLRC